MRNEAQIDSLAARHEPRNVLSSQTIAHGTNTRDTQLRFHVVDRLLDDLVSLERGMASSPLSQVELRTLSHRHRHRIALKQVRQDDLNSSGTSELISEPVMCQ